jgi:hypothetical protein
VESAFLKIAQPAVGKSLPHMNAAIPERKPATEQISGLVERVTLHNEENGFYVLRVPHLFASFAKGWEPH